MEKIASDMDVEANAIRILKWLGIGCAVFALLFLILVASLIVFVLKGTSSPAKVAESQLEAIRKGAFRDAYDSCSVDFKKKVSFDRFKKFVRANPVLRKNEKVSFNFREIKNNLALLKGKIQYNGGKTFPVEYRLIREKGKWKVLSIDLRPLPKK